VSDLLSEMTPIRTRYIRPGQGQAVEVKSGQLLQIQTPRGKQVADFVAFTLGDTEEYLSTSATRSTNANIIPQKGMSLYSNRRQPLFEIVEDTVGRHDMQYVCCDPVRYEMLGAPPGHASCRMALVDALTRYQIGYDRIPSPINWFMNVSIMQRGELEIREPLAEAGDYVLLRALRDIVAAVSACPQDLGPTNAFNPTEIVIRVYREAPLPPASQMDGATEGSQAATEPDAGASAEAVESTGEAAREPRRAEQRAARRAAAQDSAGTAQATAAAPEQATKATLTTPTRVNAPGVGRLRNTAEATVTRIGRRDGGSS
jgi:uncharacterized protein YcgI (DUF1989 family)